MYSASILYMPLCLTFLCHSGLINSLCGTLYPDLCQILLNIFLSLSFVPGEEKGRCFTIEYVMPTNVQMTSESTVSVLSK